MPYWIPMEEPGTSGGQSFVKGLLQIGDTLPGPSPDRSRGAAPKRMARFIARIRLMAGKAELSDYKIVLYVQEDEGGWVAEVPAISGCYALMDTRERALQELERVFEMIREEYAESGKPMPVDRTELLTHA